VRTSNQEEIITALWTICALLAFGFGHRFWGWVFSAKAVGDLICVIHFAREEIREDRAKAESTGHSRVI